MDHRRHLLDRWRPSADLRQVKLVADKKARAKKAVCIYSAAINWR
jgi:hypothetical protein